MSAVKGEIDMRKQTSLGVLAALASGVGVIILAASPARSAPITVLNASFEDPALTDSAYTINTIPDWDVTLNAGCSGTCVGVTNPPASDYTAAFPTDGVNTAYTDAGTGGTLSQILSTSVLANTVYTLEVDVGNRSREAGIGNYSLELHAGGSLLASVSAPVPGEGLFETNVLTYTAGAGDVGLLKIVISADRQAHFDNVRLDGTLIPEPTGFLLFSAGTLLVGLAIRRRRAA